MLEGLFLTLEAVEIVGLFFLKSNEDFCAFFEEEIDSGMAFTELSS